MSVSPSAVGMWPSPELSGAAHHKVAELGTALVCVVARASTTAYGFPVTTDPYQCTLCDYLECHPVAEQCGDTLTCNCGEEHCLFVCPWCFVSFPSFHEAGRVKAAADSRQK